ncbi:MAG: hypothetical protein GY870_12100 [archaeon]|nr:hypothetical protein [archaeon]
MITFEELGLDIFDYIILILIVVGSFLLTHLIFPIYISFAKKKGWIGNDIHKTSRPEVAESGGIVFIIGIIPSLIIIMVFYPEIMNETIVFLITILLAGLIGFYDDRKTLSALKKIIVITLSGVPITIFNYLGFISLDNLCVPFLGTLQLTIIYPLAVPLIITVMTNAFNMLEGYNGEGSGTSLIVIIFLIICSIISQASQGLIFSLSIIGALLAFFKFNKFPAKVFPGDVGTLALGSAVACIALFASLEVAMFCCILVFVFNGFYVLTSMGSLKESHQFLTKDIIVTDEDLIKPSVNKEDHLTLPRLIVAEKPMSEPELVKQFWALAYIGGIFSINAEIAKQWTLGNLDIIWFALSFILALVMYLPVIKKFPAIRVISYFMIIGLLLGSVGIIYIDLYIVNLFDFQSNLFNWLFLGIGALIAFLTWYVLTVKLFWLKISKVSGEKHEISSLEIIIDFIKQVFSLIISIIYRKDEKSE